MDVEEDTRNIKRQNKNWHRMQCVKNSHKMDLAQIGIFQHAFKNVNERYSSNLFLQEQIP